MREQDWALLGIAPTTELGAIKKAYALKLKVTRPDDDAEAYRSRYFATQISFTLPFRSSSKPSDPALER